MRGKYPEIPNHPQGGYPTYPNFSNVSGEQGTPLMMTNNASYPTYNPDFLPYNPNSRF